MEQLINSIIDYIEKDDTDYAIMISGGWGSGKTYFWNNVARRRIETVKKDGKNIKIIYISLYGVSSLSEISKNIFVEAYSNKCDGLKKVLNGKMGNAIPEVGKILVNGAGLLGLSIGNSEIDFSKLCSFENTILCFDDLERANIEVTEVLGYINNFVEHDHIKTVIIANEKEICGRITRDNYELKALTAIEILDKTGKLAGSKELSGKDKKSISEMVGEVVENAFDRSNDYKRVKEKLIGKTLVFIPDYTVIISEIIAQYKYNSNIYYILAEQFQSIVNVFNISSTKNLRILKQALDDYGVMLKHVISSYNKIIDIIKVRLLLFTLAVSFETKSGNSKASVFKDIASNTQYQSEIVQAKFAAREDTSYITEFDNKYFFGSFTDSYFYKFAEIYIRTGIFDEVTFKKEIDEIISSLDENKTKSYKKLFYNAYWKLNDDDFNKAVRDTFNDIKNGDIHYVNYYNGYITFWWFSRQGLLPDEMIEFDKAFLDGLELAKDKFPPSDEPENKLPIPENEELRFDETLRRIRDRIIHINKSLKDMQLQREIEGLFKLLNTNMKEFYKGLDERYYNIPVFAYYDMNALFENIRRLRNEDIVVFRNIMRERYKFKRYELMEEYDNLTELQKIIFNYIKDKSAMLSIVLFRELEMIIKNARETLAD